jgi:hypothetical protein
MVEVWIDVGGMMRGGGKVRGFLGDILFVGVLG